MTRRFAHLACLALAFAVPLLPGGLAAEPIRLKLSFFTSDRSVAYQAAIKPFVDAVNAEGKDVVQIDVYLSGALGRVQSELPQQVLAGGADIAFIVPGQNAERFRDNPAIELPGLFADVAEATRAYTRLIAVDALTGYQDFFVIGAFATEPETINTRKPLAALADLKGQRIRTNNLPEAMALAKLGALPAVLAFNETSPAISVGTIDGATVPPAQLFDVGIGRLVSNHYLLPTSVAPLALMMNRRVFDGLPEEARRIIRKYSGEWAAARFIEVYRRANAETLAQIRADARRNVVVPTRADAEAAGRVFKSVARDWVDGDTYRRGLLRTVEKELAQIRAKE
ncbi:MAG TPA: TRAP transporter substrate-binding protein DctP [Xanthobacteraceae bacterium]|nr:TRAP transporter substrate-binding protein DctP [Xanthobacteraceae bacterium]